MREFVGFQGWTFAMNHRDCANQGTRGGSWLFQLGGGCVGVPAFAK